MLFADTVTGSVSWGTEFTSEAVQQMVFTTRNEAANQQPNADWATTASNEQAAKSTLTSHVQWFGARRGYSFITGDGGDGDVFVHHSGMQGAIQGPAPRAEGR